MIMLDVTEELYQLFYNFLYKFLKINNGTYLSDILMLIRERSWKAIHIYFQDDGTVNHL